MAKTAIVVGGSIGGLAVAVGLHEAGWRVRVLERSPEQVATGTGLSMWPQAREALDQLGVPLDWAALATPRQQGGLRRPDGSVVARMAMDESITMVARPTLLDALAARLPAGIVEQQAVTDPLSLAAECDVLIGADGIHSTVREVVFPGATRRRYNGYIAYRGRSAAPPPAVCGMTWGKNAMFGIMPMDGGTTYWFASIGLPADHVSPDGNLGELRRRFGDWHDPIPSLLADAREDEVLRHECLYLAPSLRTFVRGNVALVGDAAHAMTPDMGQGANQTILDAHCLARCLTTSPSVRLALTRYDRIRRRPAQRIARTSTVVGRMTTSRFWPELRLRVMGLLIRLPLPG
ncbi:hypothetical protein D5S17_06700 [Pseudonocardiaceae bacterium YIM PH 21723]|nr:hypothetical protein D5S17_06700 [Pseudonocardiaceae bacterium YIM PH 21723]